MYKKVYHVLVITFIIGLIGTIFFNVNASAAASSYKINNTFLYFDKMVYIDANYGNDTTGSGTEASPFQSIRKAMDYLYANGGAAIGECGIIMNNGNYDYTPVMKGANDNMDGKFNGMKISFIAKNPGKAFIYSTAGMELGIVEISASYRIKLKFYRIVFHDITDNDSTPCFHLGMDDWKNEFYNCVFDSPTYIGGWNGKVAGACVKTVNCLFYKCTKNGYTVSGEAINNASTNTFIDPVSGTKTTCLVNVVADSNYNITSEGWEGNGTGINPDGSPANIGVYGGEFAWSVPAHFERLPEKYKINTTEMSFDKTVYIDSARGNDTTGSGTLGSPFGSIRKAMDYLKDIQTPYRVNWALKDNGGVATSNWNYTTYTADKANDGDITSSSNWWTDYTNFSSNDWLRVDMPKVHSIKEIVVRNYGTSSSAGAAYFDVQYYNGSSWVNVPGRKDTGSYYNSDLIIDFDPVTTSKIRLTNFTLMSGKNCVRAREIEVYSQRSEYAIVMNDGSYDFTPVFKGTSDNIDGKFNGMKISFIAKNAGKASIYASNGLQFGVVEVSAAYRLKLKFYQLVFNHMTDNDTSPYFILGMDDWQNEYYNCVFDGIKKMGGWTGVISNACIRTVNCLFNGCTNTSYTISGEATNDASTSTYIDPVSGAKTTCLVNAVADSNYAITSEGWQHNGTGTNPDGSPANIGVYGGGICMVHSPGQGIGARNV